MNHIAKNLRALRDKKGLKQSDFEDIGIKRTAWNNYERGQSVPKPELLLAISKRLEVSLEDLISQDLTKNVELTIKQESPRNNEYGRGNSRANGRGNEKNDKNLAQESEPEIPYGKGPKTALPKVVVVDTEGKENIVFVPVKARAGYLAGYGDIEYIRKLPVYRFPKLNNGSFRAFEVSGASMETMFHEGDIVVCRWIERLADIREKGIYVFLTETEGIAIKRILSHILATNKIILGSENPIYSPVLVDYAEIREIWQPVAYLSTTFRSQAHLESRVSELESRLIRIEEKQAIHPLK